MSADFPDHFVLVPQPENVPLAWEGFPHSVALLPEGKRIDDLRASAHIIGVFLIEPDSIGEVLNGTALTAYLDRDKPVLLHATRARDLRPVLSRSAAFLSRGYRIAMFSDYAIGR